MTIDDKKLLAFLAPQMRDHGGQVQLDADLWILFAVAASDEEGNAIARWLLDGTSFANDSGPSEDDQWTLYYVHSPDRAEAIHWLEDLQATRSGRIRPPSPAQRALIEELGPSRMPHRVAQKLVELHERGELSAGVVQDPLLVRTLLDRLHFKDTLFMSALHSLLSHHLVDLIVLLQQMLAENIELEDELGGNRTLSRDPFEQKGQIAAADIRNQLTRFNVINPLDQQTNTVVTNPYAAFMDVIIEGDKVTATIAGNIVMLPRDTFLEAIRTVRRNLYRGAEFNKIDTQVPWMRDEIAHSFRFIKQRLDAKRDVPSMDALYMLERAVELVA
jgi:hypothetical protein